MYKNYFLSLLRKQKTPEKVRFRQIRQHYAKSGHDDAASIEIFMYICGVLSFAYRKL